jgi:CheY-like chemotaxis protein
VRIPEELRHVFHPPMILLPLFEEDSRDRRGRAPGVSLLARTEDGDRIVVRRRGQPRTRADPAHPSVQRRLLDAHRLLRPAGAASRGATPGRRRAHSPSNTASPTPPREREPHECEPRAIIAEDEVVLRDELAEDARRALAGAARGRAVDDGIAALRALRAASPDIAFLDIQMPGLSGFEVARQLARRCHIAFVTPSTVMRSRRSSKARSIT